MYSYGGGPGMMLSMEAGVTESNAQSGGKRRVLPTPRIAFAKQLDLLRAYSAASGEGVQGVPNEQVANIVGMSASTVSLANPFFADIGLIHRGGGGYIPAPEVVAFARSYQWDEDYAGTEIGPLLRDSWFGQALMPRLQFSPISEDVALRELGKAANAAPKYRAQLRTLLDYLKAGNLIVRNGEMIEADRDAPSGTSKPSTATEGPQDKQAEKPAEPVVPGGPLPLLIQGLLQQLPRDQKWSRSKAERWLDLAKLTFETVYDFEDAPASGGTSTTESDDSQEDEEP